MKEFCKEEVNLYEEIIDLLEYDISENYILQYNGIPIRIRNKILIKLCDETIDYDAEKYITFKPLKNHRHCQLILDFLHENENEKIELIVKKNMEEKNRFTGILTDTELDIVINQTDECFSEIEAKFKVLYTYLFDDKNINKRINKIRKYDNSYKRELKNSQTKKKKR
jgi:hypothetical protein